MCKKLKTDNSYLVVDKLGNWFIRYFLYVIISNNILYKNYNNIINKKLKTVFIYIVTLFNERGN